TLNFCAPSTPCPSSASATLKTGSGSQLLSSISHLPPPATAAVPTAYSLRSIASIRPVSRIVMPRATLTSDAKNRDQKSVNTSLAISPIGKSEGKMIPVNLKMTEMDQLDPQSEVLPPGGIIMRDVMRISKANKSFYSAKDEAKATLPKFCEETWNKAIEAVQACVETYTQVIEVRKGQLDCVPEDKKDFWKALLRTLEKDKDYWVTKSLLTQAEKDEVIAHIALAKVNDASPECYEEEWERARESVEVTVFSYSLTIDSMEKERGGYWYTKYDKMKLKKASLMSELFSTKVNQAQEALYAVLSTIQKTDSNIDEEEWIGILEQLRTAEEDYNIIMNDCEKTINDVAKEMKIYAESGFRIFQDQKPLLALNAFHPFVIKILQLRELVRKPLIQGCDLSEITKDDWAQVKETAQIASEAYSKIVYFLKKRVEDSITKADKDYWQNLLQQAKNKQYIFNANLWAIEALRAEDTLLKAVFKAYTCNDSSSDTAWSEVLENALKVVEAFSQVVDIFESLPSHFTETENDLFYREKALQFFKSKRAHWAADLFSLKILRAQRIADVMLTQAEKAPSEVANKAWAKAIEAIYPVQEACSEAENVFQQAADNTIQDSYLIESLKYITATKISLTAKHFEIQAKKEEKAIQSALARAEEALKELNQDVWEKAIADAKSSLEGFSQAADSHYKIMDNEIFRDYIERDSLHPVLGRSVDTPFHLGLQNEKEHWANQLFVVKVLGDVKFKKDI
ncbi:MAG TPA: hypothetical protein VJK54_02200, partial [Chthoniobacterales bacterium]|nr:hypothetical protein [Chthoniobacterales bacterium]